MEVQYFGANCVRLTTKKATLVFDDDSGKLSKAGDIAIYTTTQHATPAATPSILIDYPGEYEVSGVSVRGIAARSHLAEEANDMSATIYKLIVDDMRVVVLGHIYPELNDDQLEAIGNTDLLIAPVGGNGYTLDATGALKLIRKIEPRLVIPTHYADSKVDYPVPQATLEDALKNLSMEPSQTTDRLKLKTSDLPEVTQLIVLERQ